MNLSRITDIAGLHRHLHAALQLEHATIPPYLTALYSIRPGTNSEAYHIIRAVVVEEMLHLTLAANVLNAVGGTPDLTEPGFMPRYPAYLPDGEEDFRVDLRRFSQEAIETFLKIERPALSPEDEPPIVARERTEGSLRASHVEDGSTEHFYSIGEFYRAISESLEHLHEQHGAALFSGDPARQIGPEYYYSGGGDIIAVTDIHSARAALELIAEQGEGVTDHVFQEGKEIPHYFRFEQLLLGRYYREGDARGEPSGGGVEVDWDAVFPIRTNARVADYPEGSDLRAGAERFNSEYRDFLGFLTQALQGEPQRFIEAVGDMFRFKEMSCQLMQQPIDGSGGEHAAPTFEVNLA